MAEYITEYCHFTATDLDPIAIGWKNLLAKDKYKNIVIESMPHLVINKKVIIYGFVLINNSYPPALANESKYKTGCSPKRFPEAYSTGDQEWYAG